MKKISMLLAIIMLMSTLYIPAYAVDNTTNVFVDEGTLPYFNTFATGSTLGSEYANTTTDEGKTVTIKDNSLVFYSDGTNITETRFTPVYSNLSENRQPLVLEYKVKFDSESTSAYFTHQASADSSNNKYTHGIQVYPYKASEQAYFSRESSVEKFTLDGDLTKWHTVSIVYSTSDNKKQLYWDGIYKGTSTLNDIYSNIWDDKGSLGTVRFYQSAGKAGTTFTTYIDYIKLYEKPSSFGVKLLDADKTEFDEFKLDFNATASNLSTTNITFGGKTPKTIELIDEAKHVYKVTLSEKLNPSTEYKLSLNGVSNMVGQSITADISFKTREPKQLCYDISPVSGTNIVTGENKFNVTYINETQTGTTNDLVVAQFDKDNIMIKSEKIPVTMEALKDTSVEKTVTLSEDVKSVQLFIMGTDGKTNYSGAYYFDRDGEPSKEEFIALPSDLEPSYSYKVLDTTDEVSIEIANEEDATSNIILTDANSKVVYEGQHNTIDKKANFIFRLKESGTYTLLYKMNGNSKWYEDTIKYYSADYVANRFEEFNTTDDINVIAGYITEFEEVLGLDSGKLNSLGTPEEKNLIYTSLLTQRNELENKKYADTDAVNTALGNAYNLYDLYKGNKKASEVAKDLVDATYYNFMDANYSDELIKYIDSEFNGKMYSSDSLFNKAFCESVVLSGVYKGENFSLTSKIISDLASKIPLDLTTYSVLSNPSNVDINLSAKPYADISTFIGAFNSEVQNQYNIEHPVIILPPQTPGVSFSGGGGGGSKPSEEVTPPQEVIPPEVTSPQEKFSDLSGFDWAKDAISNLADKGIVNGVSDNAYNPAGVVKREEFVKMIDTLYSAEAETSSFNDVNQSEWYASYINKAVTAGIIKGMNENTFGLGQGVTREDMAVMIVRALKLETVTTEEIFTDDLSIADYAKEAVYTLRSKGIISGTGNGNYEPKRIMTRAEAAVLINNILNVID